MQSKIYKWENGRAVEVNSVRDAKIKPPEPHVIEEKYKKERAESDAIKKQENKQ